jgi:hypothetical protein
MVHMFIKMVCMYVLCCYVMDMYGCGEEGQPEVGGIGHHFLGTSLPYSCISSQPLSYVVYFML